MIAYPKKGPGNTPIAITPDIVAGAQKGTFRLKYVMFALRRTAD
jgi:hypothetical protein